MTAAARRECLRDLLGEHDLDALLVTTPVNVRYLTGFTGSAGEVVVTATGDDVFVTDGRYAEQSATQCPDLRRLVVPPPTWLRDALAGAQRLGVESHTVAWDRVRSLERDLDAQIVPAPRLVERLRTVKDGVEIAALRRACAVADDAFTALTGWLHPGMTEHDAARRLDAEMLERGAAERSFPTILAAGPNSAIPHHQPADRVMRRGDVVKVDFGALVEGYHSDMTRMLSLGAPARPLADIVELVLAAQAAGVAAVRDGAATAAVDAACRGHIGDAGYGAHFVHGTGHGVGLEIHEDPFLRPREPADGVATAPSVTLRAGMTVTVEPGVYLPGVGGVRIEDTLVVTPEGADALTRTPKDLVVL